MRSQEELVALAHSSFRACFEKLAGHCAGGAVRSAPGVFSFVTGVRFSLFNGCVVTGPVAPEDVDEAIAWVRERGLPYRVWIVEELLEGLGETPPQHGLEQQPDPYPGMVLHPVPEAPALAEGVEVVSREEIGADAAVRVATASGMPGDLAELLFDGSFVEDPDVQVFVGRLEGRSVGTSVAIQGGGASGVVAVGTLAEARRRGVGTALSWAAAEAGRQRGFDTVVLQASPMGLPVYEAMGFTTVVAYADFVASRT